MAPAALGDRLQVGAHVEDHGAAVLGALDVVGAVGVLADAGHGDGGVLGLDGVADLGGLSAGDGRVGRAATVPGPPAPAALCDRLQVGAHVEEHGAAALVAQDVVGAVGVL